MCVGVWSGCLSVSLSSLSGAYLLDRLERIWIWRWMEIIGLPALAAAPLLRCSQHTRYGGVSLVGCAYAKRACWALSCCLLLGCHNHTHTHTHQCVCVWRWRRRWRWDRLRWGVVRWGSSVCGCVWGGSNHHPNTNEQTDDPPVGIERER